MLRAPMGKAYWSERDLKKRFVENKIFRVTNVDGFSKALSHFYMYTSD
jgi:hypothetical protein